MKTKTTSWDAAEHLPPASGQRNAGRWLAETIMNEKIAIYGDGTRDDAPAIQAMLDSGTSAVILPIPRLRYAIGTTLKIHSGQTIRLEPTTEIRLLPGSNCAMLMNDPAEEAPHDIYLEESDALRGAADGCDVLYSGKHAVRLSDGQSDLSES